MTPDDHTQINGDLDLRFDIVYVSSVSGGNTLCWSKQVWEADFNLVDLLRPPVLQTLKEVQFCEKIRFRELIFVFELVIPWDRRLEPHVYRHDGGLWVGRRIHFQDFAYLDKEGCFKFQMGLAAEALLALCRKYNLATSPAERLTKKYPVTLTSYSPIEYKTSIQLVETKNEFEKQLTDRELGFNSDDRANWCVTPPFTDDEIAKINIKTLNIWLPVDLFPPNKFVEVANAMRHAPYAALRVQDNYIDGYLGLDFLEYFRNVGRVCFANLYRSSLDELRRLSRDLVRLELDLSCFKDKPPLDFLDHFDSLQALTIRGHYEDLSKFPKLKSLQALKLDDVNLKDLSSISSFENLQSLSISSRKLQSLSELPRFKQLRHFSLSKASKISSVDEVKTLTNLEYLRLTDLSKLQALPSLKPLTKLRRLHVEAVKNLVDLRTVADAPALEELMIFRMKQIEPEHLQCFSNHATCKQLETDKRKLRNIMGFTGVLSGSVFKFTGDRTI